MNIEKNVITREQAKAVALGFAVPEGQVDLNVVKANQDQFQFKAKALGEHVVNMLSLASKTNTDGKVTNMAKAQLRVVDIDLGDGTILQMTVMAKLSKKRVAGETSQRVTTAAKFENINSRIDALSHVVEENAKNTADMFAAIMGKLG